MHMVYLICPLSPILSPIHRSFLSSNPDDLHLSCCEIWFSVHYLSFLPVNNMIVLGCMVSDLLYSVKDTDLSFQVYLLSPCTFWSLLCYSNIFPGLLLVSSLTTLMLSQCESLLSFCSLLQSLFSHSGLELPIVGIKGHQRYSIIHWRASVRYYCSLLV